MGRHANPDIRRAFAEFQDSETPSKCNKVRCHHCGFVRAKNTTRQIEHLQECAAYLASADGQAHLASVQNNGGTEGTAGSHATMTQPAILTGQHPNPNLQVHRRGPNSKRTHGQLIASHGTPSQPSAAASLTNHLLSLYSAPFTQATQNTFLSHAGCGSLAAGPLCQWLVQDAHYARGYIRFVGQLLAKIRLPQTLNSQFHPMYRTMDLLISALNNMRREMQFFEITATKFTLNIAPDPPTPITRSLLDLFVSASSSSASLLEGMVVLWGIGHCYRSAWTYASQFHTSLSTPSNESHIVALHQALIPNWTSPAFSKFVDATRGLVDELANITTAPDGKVEMQRCEEIFRQICWLEERFWPDVDGMGEEDESARLGGLGGGSAMNDGMGDSGIGGPSMGPSMNGAPSMTASSMSGQMNPPGINGPSMGSNMSGPSMNGGDGTPVSDGRNSYGGMESVGQSS